LSAFFRLGYVLVADENKGRQNANMRLQKALYEPQFGLILANNGIILARFLKLVIGRFYGRFSGTVKRNNRDRLVSSFSGFAIQNSRHCKSFCNGSISREILFCPCWWTYSEPVKIL
jgi:hypothetical protein